MMQKTALCATDFFYIFVGTKNTTAFI